MPHDIDARIVALARRQHGIVTRAQLLDLGMPTSTIGRRVRSSYFRRLHRGVYLVGPILPPLAREMAAILALGRTAAVSHRSAAVLWRLLPPDTSSPVDVTVVGEHVRRRRGLRVRCVTSLEEGERTTRDRIPLTAVGRTLLDLALVADGRELERAVARAQRERLIGGDELETLLARHRGRRGVRRLRRVVLAEPALTDSEAEDAFLALIAKAGLPRPRANPALAGFRVDFFWPAHRLVVEIDGYRYHSSRPGFEGDRRKAARLAALGYQVVRLTWRQVVDHGLATAVQLGQALARASVR